jgi:hypothetical protein
MGDRVANAVKQGEVLPARQRLSGEAVASTEEFVGATLDIRISRPLNKLPRVIGMTQKANGKSPGGIRVPELLNVTVEEGRWTGCKVFDEEFARELLPFGEGGQKQTFGEEVEFRFQNRSLGRLRDQLGEHSVYLAQYTAEMSTQGLLTHGKSVWQEKPRRWGWCPSRNRFISGTRWED